MCAPEPVPPITVDREKVEKLCQWLTYQFDGQEGVANQVRAIWAKHEEMVMAAIPVIENVMDQAKCECIPAEDRERILARLEVLRGILQR